MKIVTIVEGQNIWDISIQEYGSVTSVFDFIADNGFADGLNTNLTPGQKVKIISAPSDKGVLQYFQTNKLRVVGGQFVLRALAYAFGAERVEITNGGGDSWTIHVPYDAPGIFGSMALDHATVEIHFYSAGVGYDLVNEEVTVATDYTFSEGAGTYIVIVNYHLVTSFYGGAPFGISSQAYAMVDGAGALIRSAHVDGMTDVSINGGRISATASYDFVNCATSQFNGCVAFDASFSHYIMLDPSNVLVDVQLPSYSFMYLVGALGLDYAEWTDGPFAIDLTGCAMTIYTNG
jgi:hypothetical protein